MIKSAKTNQRRKAIMIQQQYTIKRRKGQHLTLIERGKIEAFLKINMPKIQIASEIGISTRTLYREINRGMVKGLLNSDYSTYDAYSAEFAHKKYLEAMKPITILSLGVTLVLSMTSCNKFLDENPYSSLVEPDNASKIEKLLGSAYSTSSIAYLTELSSDNIQDDGVNNPYTNQFCEKAAYWETIVNSDGLYDAPYLIWQNTYNSIAHANEALEDIEALGGDKEELQGIKGEALLARAYGHFCLANLFCLPYDPSSSSTDPGIPYIKKRVVNLQPNYPRGTMAETFEQIAADLEAGIPLLEKYSNYTDKEKKFHFTAASAHAFAARFFLYYQKWTEAIAHADKVLGSDPKLVLRNWKAFYSIPRTDASFALAYYDISNPANLLTVPTYSYYPWLVTGGTAYYNTRFTQSQELTLTETLFAKNIWGTKDPYWFQPFIYTEGNINKTVQPKLPTFPSNSIQTIETPFTTDETLLVRAEAKLHLGSSQYTSAIEDMNLWTTNYLNDGENNSRQKTFTQQEIVAFYSALPIDSEGKASIRKAFNAHFTIASDEENALLQHLLQCRRILTMHEGLRWQDIKRFGIPIYRRLNNGYRYIVQDKLPGRDPRHAIQLPSQATKGAITPNPTTN